MVKNNKIVLTGVLIALISISGMIRIPVPFYVPVTLQMLTVFLAPMVAGVRVSFAAIFLYIVLGLAGLPVFSTGGGFGYIFMPSFGYLIGFLLSSIPNGLISGRSTGFWRNFTGGAVALVTIHAVGILGFWLNMHYVQDKEISLIAAAMIAAVPFLLPDAVKLTIAALIAGRLKKASLS